MARDIKHVALKLMTIGAAACTSVYAARSAPQGASERDALVAPRGPSPYSIDLVDESGQTLETYQRGGRFYVLGGAGQRYSVRVTNPSDRRIEAVLSIDGLDVIDGQSADFVAKRGYIVPAHDVLVVEGFRTSASAVAAFRFSSVGESYAERKGKGRNVGVVGVAIFQERGNPTVILPQPEPYGPADDWGGYRDEVDAESAPATGRGGASPSPAKGDSGARSAEPAAVPSLDKRAAQEHAPMVGGGAGAVCCGPRPSRPGLGTAFGEQRWSQVSFTRFERRNPRTPDAVAELRYNDAAGLAALGIAIERPYDDLAVRETADPFPMTRYAEPPR